MVGGSGWLPGQKNNIQRVNQNPCCFQHWVARDTHALPENESRIILLVFSFSQVRARACGTETHLHPSAYRNSEGSSSSGMVLRGHWRMAGPLAGASPPDEGPYDTSCKLGVDSTPTPRPSNVVHDRARRMGLRSCQGLGSSPSRQTCHRVQFTESCATSWRCL